jgi:predicted methyltransferase
MKYAGPLLTHDLNAMLLGAARSGARTLQCSLDLGRTQAEVAIEPDAWCWRDTRYPYAGRCRERTVYYWTGAAYEPVARYGNSLVKLIPTEWGAPTFEIDGVKMLPTSRISPYEDARAKVALIEPAGKRVLDTCAGLGYFAAWCLAGGARDVRSWERNPDVLWLRDINPWSPGDEERLRLQQGDVAAAITELPAASCDAALHDPPRFALAGELYAQAFYDELARVLVPGGPLFHYVGAPNRLTSGRDVPREVASRLQRAGFSTRLAGDGVFATRARRR